MWLIQFLKNNTFDSINVTYNVDAKVINADSVDCNVFETDKFTILNSSSETNAADAIGVTIENSNSTASNVNFIGRSLNGAKTGAYNKVLRC